jgi:predicted TIM-barrel fold metal-dependent hydrolase
MTPSDSDSTLAHWNKPRERVTFLPEPQPEDLWCPLISVDDHALEPLTLFEEHGASKLQDRLPFVIFDSDDVPYWVIDGSRLPIIVNNGAVGRPMDEWGVVPSQYDDFRRGVFDPTARLIDMDLVGIWASLCFGSAVWGFAGWRFSKMSDQEAGLEALRAYNRWMINVWCAAAPDRFIPCQLPWLANPKLAADEIYANAESGFKSVSFPENPEPLGFPEIYSEYWGPLFRACDETSTVINLHVGSSGKAQVPSSSSPAECWVGLFPLSAMEAAFDWVYARIPIHYPNVKIALSEGGVSWVPMIVERFARAFRQLEASDWWTGGDPDPVECFRRAFYFCSIEDPMAFRNLDAIGADHVMIECDYPHQDSSWPHTQSMVKAQLEHLDISTIERICFANAAELYRHEQPPPHMLASAEVRQAGFQQDRG